MAKIEAVVFDAGGVLHEQHDGTRADVAAALSLDEHAMAEIWRELMPLLGQGKIDEAEFWERISEAYFTRAVSTEENLLGHRFSAELNPHHEVLSLAERLGELGYKRAVLSNTIEPHARALREIGLYDGFDAVVLSHEVGLQKPSPEIFQLVLSELKVEPENTIYTDDLDNLLLAAQELGMHGIPFRNSDQFRSDLTQYIPEL